MEHASDNQALERYNLSPKQVEFLTLYTANAFIPPRDIAKQIGVTQPTVRRWMTESDKFRMALQREENRMRSVTDMSRQKVMHGLLEAIDLARDNGKPAQMIAGWREVGRMCGFYEPERRELRISVESKQFMENIRTLPKEKLLELMHEQDALEGEHTVLATDEGDEQ